MAQQEPHYLRSGESVVLPLGPVTVIDYIEAGTFGQVYKVLQTTSPNCFRALKVTSRRNHSAAGQTYNEIQTYKLMQHEFSASARSGIGSMLDSSLSDEHFLFILLDFYQYSLLQWLQSPQGKEGVSLRIIHRLVHDLCPVLCEMSRLGLRHTDIKPDNIMVTPDGHFRLVDFGGARPRDAEVGSYVQTRWSRAPEVALGCSPTCAADIWSFGCVLAEMFLGDAVFAGQQGVQYLQLMQVRLGEFSQRLISAASTECRGHFVNGKLQAPSGPVPDGSRFQMWPLRRLLDAKSFDGDPEEAKPVFIDLILDMLMYDPGKRATAEEIVDSRFFQLDMPPL
jgi:serine/threonine protein kinase